MSVIITRQRTLGIRLSDEEYTALDKFCVETGARSISDLARMAISSYLNRVTEENALTSALNENVAQVRELEQKLERISAELAILKANSMDQRPKKGKR